MRTKVRNFFFTLFFAGEVGEFAGVAGTKNLQRPRFENNSVSYAQKTIIFLEKYGFFFGLVHREGQICDLM